MSTNESRSKYHRDAEERIRQDLEGMGFYCPALPYHAALSTDQAAVLRTRYSPTALYLRNRSDRMAIHKLLPVEFEWEVKTRESTRYDNLSLEALQLAQHVVMGQLDVRCLYIYSDPFSDFECGFWTTALPPISCVQIPLPRWGQVTSDWYKAKLATAFPSTRILATDRSAGSNTPFALINHADLIALPHWRTLVQSELDDSTPEKFFQNNRGNLLQSAEKVV